MLDDLLLPFNSCSIRSDMNKMIRRERVRDGEGGLGSVKQLNCA